MHRQLEGLLNRVKGESQHVIAISVDVRDFSRFSQRQDSADVALFISKFYLELIKRFRSVIDEFFFKPTGDGLMICIPYDEDNLQDRFSNVIQVSLDCHEDFSNMFDDVSVINFVTPSLLGIGIARGSSCAIVGVDDDPPIIVDYSGHKLNLAARLQDLARPSGIIFENSNDVMLLNEDIKAQFESIDIYVRSVAEKEPISVCCLYESVRIPPENLKPLAAQWMIKNQEFTRTQFLKTVINYNVHLEPGTVVPETLKVRLMRPAIRSRDGFGGSTARVWRNLVLGKHFNLIQEGDEFRVQLVLQQIKKDEKEFIDKARVKDGFKFHIDYQLM